MATAAERYAAWLHEHGEPVRWEVILVVEASVGEMEQIKREIRDVLRGRGDVLSVDTTVPDEGGTVILEDE